MSSTRRSYLAVAFFVACVASALLGYWIRSLQDSSAWPAASRGTAPVLSSGGAARGSPPAGAAAGPGAVANPRGRLAEDDTPTSGSTQLADLSQLSAAELIEALRSAAASHDAQRFWLVAAALGPLDPSQVPQIVLFLDDRQTDGKAAELLFGELVHYGGPVGLDAISRRVLDSSTEPRMRNAAVAALGGIPAERRTEAVPILRDLLKSGLRFDEPAGAQTLGWLLGPGAVAGIVEIVDWWVTRPEGSTPIEKGSWDEINVVNGILQAVQDFAGPEHIDLLSSLFGSGHERDLQALLCQVLSRAAGAAATETMLDLLLHPPEGAIRDVIAEALGKSVVKKDVPQLKAALEAESERRVQMLLASMLARLAGVEEMRPLVARSLEPGSRLSPDVLIEPLLRAKNKEMAPLMLELLLGVEGQYAVCRLAKGVLGLLGQEEGAEKLLSTVTAGGGYRAVSEVARALLEAHPDHDPRQLLNLLERSSDNVQRNAIVDVLRHEREAYASSAASGEVIPVLVRILADEKDPATQEHIASAIASLGPDGRDSLAELLAQDTDARRRLEVLRSLELLPPRDTAPLALRVLEQDPSPEVRSKAARIAGMADDPSLVDALSAILVTEEDPAVRRAIEEALRRRGER